MVGRLPCFLCLLLALGVSGCGDDGGTTGDSDTGTASTSGTGGSPESENAPAEGDLSEPALVKLVGEWRGVTEYDADVYESLVGPDGNDEIESMVATATNQVYHVTLGESGTLVSRIGSGDEMERADGTWEVTDDQHDTATLVLNMQSGDMNVTFTFRVDFVSDDEYVARSTQIAGPEGLFFVRFQRQAETPAN